MTGTWTSLNGQTMTREFKDQDAVTALENLLGVKVTVGQPKPQGPLIVTLAKGRAATHRGIVKDGQLRTACQPGKVQDLREVPGAVRAVCYRCQGGRV